MYTIDTDLRQLPNFTAEELNNFIAQPAHRASDKLLGKGQSFVDAGNLYEVNPVFLMALAACESAWGRSSLAQNRNALFGYKAFDADPNQASGYGTPESSIRFIAHFLSWVYLRPANGAAVTLLDNSVSMVGQWWGGSATPKGVFVHYSSAGINEAETIAEIMREFQEFASQPAVGGVGDDAVVASVAPVETRQLATYTTQRGDTLWGIAIKVYGDPQMWDDIRDANGITNPKLLPTGVTLVLPQKFVADPVEPSTAPQAPAETVYTVVSGDSLWSLAERFYGNGALFSKIFDANRSVITDAGHIEPGWRLTIPA